MHLGWRSECSRGQGEKFFDASMELCGRGKQAVIAAAGFSGNAAGYFTLHQDHKGLEVFCVLEEAQENVGSDVVRKVADDLCRRWLEFDAGTAEAGLGAKQGIEIHGENIGFDDLDVRKHAEAQAKLGGQYAVKFDGDQAAGAFGQQGSKHAASGADFKHGTLRDVAERVNNL